MEKLKIPYTGVCPICGEGKFEKFADYDDCRVCGWCNDDDDYFRPDQINTQNRVSLYDAQKLWKKGISSDQLWELKDQGKKFTVSGLLDGIESV